MATIYRLLSEEGKAQARQRARDRYQRNRDERRRKAYVIALRRIKNPRRETLEAHGFQETPEGWFDEKGNLIKVN